LTKLQHPNILRAFTVGFPKASPPYLVLEFLEGKSLAALLAEQEHLKWQQVRRIFEQIMDGVSFAHQQGIIHRDLKPSNVLIVEETDRATAKIVDFGIAGFLDESDQKLTQTGNIVGTPAYMAPEVCSGKPASELSDIYALGCMLYEMCCGKPAFSADSPYALFYKHAAGDYESFDPRDKSTPAPIARIVDHCLRKDAAERYQNVGELQADFALAAEGLEPSELASRQKARAPWKRVATAFVATLLLASTGLFIAQQMMPPRVAKVEPKPEPAPRWSQSAQDEIKHETKRAIGPLRPYLPDADTMFLADVEHAEQLRELGKTASLDPMRPLTYSKEAAEAFHKIIRHVDKAVPKPDNVVAGSVLRLHYMDVGIRILHDPQISDKLFDGLISQMHYYAQQLLDNEGKLERSGVFKLNQLFDLHERVAHMSVIKLRRYKNRWTDEVRVGLAKEALHSIDRVEEYTKDRPALARLRPIGPEETEKLRRFIKDPSTPL
jgi:serine/threonine protein kinase